MKTRRWLMFVSCVFPLSGFAATLDLKPGSWEVVMATSVAGLPIPQDALAKMPPDQRAKFEEAMKARAGKVNTSTMHTCVTKEDLDRGDLMKSERDNCTRKVIDQSARRFEVEETVRSARSVADPYDVRFEVARSLHSDHRAQSGRGRQGPH